MVFLECTGLMFGFERWKSVWSSLRDFILAEKTDEQYLVVLSSDWFSRQTLFGQEASLFAEFLKDIQDTGGKAIGLLSAPIDGALFPWADVLSRMGLINFLEPVGCESSYVGEQSLEVIDGCRIINFGNNTKCIKQAGGKITQYQGKTYCFATHTLPNETPQEVTHENTQENISWIFQGMLELCIENENCVELSTFEGGIRLLQESETGYSCSSLLFSSRHKDLPLQEISVHSEKSWLETAEEEVFDTLAEAGKCGVFWKAGIGNTSIGELRKRISYGDDDDNFFEFLRQAMNSS